MAKQIKIEWTPSASNTVAPTSQVVERSATENGTFDVIHTASNNTTDEYIDTNVSDGETWWYKVGAVFASGNTVYLSADDITVSDAQLAAPTGLIAGTETDTTAPITWTAAANATSYLVYVNGTANGQSFTGTAGTVTGLTAETTYTITLVSVASGYTNSAQSSSVSVTTEAVSLTPDPTNVYDNQFMTDTDADGLADTWSKDASQTATIVSASVGDAQRIDGSLTYKKAQIDLGGNPITALSTVDFSMNYRSGGSGDKKIYINNNSGSIVLPASQAVEGVVTGTMTEDSGFFQGIINIQCTAADGWFEVSNLVINNITAP